MTTWRPHPHIRVVAIGLHWRDGRLLAAEVRDDAGRLKGVRPLGGEIEFGESWRAALVREFHEELDIDITITQAEEDVHLTDPLATTSPRRGFSCAPPCAGSRCSD
jgi:8-oxo-dGTP pyrophosphatase MutT (NUDIX family)